MFYQKAVKVYNNVTLWIIKKYGDDRAALVVDLKSGNAKITNQIPPDW